MIKVLVVETTKCGYDGITNVIKNYFLYQEDPEIQMDLVTINEAVPESKSAEICDEAAKNPERRRVSDYPCTWMQWNDGSRNAGGKISRDQSKSCTCT